MAENSLELQLKNTAGALIQQAEAVVIKDSDGMREANTFFLACTTMVKRIKAYWNGTPSEPGPKDLAYKAWKSLCDKEAEMLRIPEKAKGIVENKLRDYRDEERRRAAEDQRKADELRRKEEQRLKEAEMKKAERALDKGNEAKAEEHLQRADEVFVPPVEVQPTVGKTERTDIGAVTGIMDLKIEVVSMRELARAVADGKLPEHILEARLGQIKTWAKGNGIKNLMANGLVITEFERFQGREAKAEAQV
jgi:hypothetical protein